MHYRGMDRTNIVELHPVPATIDERTALVAQMAATIASGVLVNSNAGSEDQVPELIRIVVDHSVEIAEQILGEVTRRQGP